MPVEGKFRLTTTSWPTLPTSSCRSRRALSSTSQINNLVGELEGGGWIGRGADAFYAEMHDLVNPGLQRLGRALEDAGGAIKQISDILSQAEQEASFKFTSR